MMRKPEKRDDPENKIKIANVCMILAIIFFGFALFCKCVDLFSYLLTGKSIDEGVQYEKELEEKAGGPVDYIDHADEYNVYYGKDSKELLFIQGQELMSISMNEVLDKAKNDSGDSTITTYDADNCRFIISISRHENYNDVLTISRDGNVIFMQSLQEIEKEFSEGLEDESNE